VCSESGVGGSTDGGSEAREEPLWRARRPSFLSATRPRPYCCNIYFVLSTRAREESWSTFYIHCVVCMWVAKRVRGSTCAQGFHDAQSGGGSGEEVSSWGMGWLYLTCCFFNE
jgi:hypothetical protein